MQARYVQSGQVIDITAENEVHAGDILVVGDRLAELVADVDEA